MMDNSRKNNSEIVIKSRYALCEFRRHSLERGESLRIFLFILITCHNFNFNINIVGKSETFSAYSSADFFFYGKYPNQNWEVNGKQPKDGEKIISNKIYLYLNKTVFGGPILF